MKKAYWSYKIVEGNTSGIVERILDEYLSVPSDKMDVEASTTNVKILPTKKSPFTLIKSFLPKTISEKIAIKRKKKKDKKESSNLTSDVSDSETKKGSGTAGYLFFQTNRGHVFRSIDSLVSTNKDEFNVDNWKKTLDINLTGTFLSIKYFLKHHLNKDVTQKIINIGSIYGVVSPHHEIYKNQNFSSSIGYTASKSG